MAIKRDYYEILGVERDASDNIIRTAFRKLAFKYHPDHNQETGAEDKFKELNEAYEVLSDPQKRSTYDRYGHQSVSESQGDDAWGFGFGGLGDIFDAFFGGATGTARPVPQQGADIEQMVTVAFREAVLGGEKEIKLSRIEFCSGCGGTGCVAGSQPARCPTCNGSGQVRRVQQNIFGRFTNIAPCPQCHGEGRVINGPCLKCRGSGKEKRESGLIIQVPAGVEDGSRIRLTGEGDAGTRGGSPGDLYVRLKVEPHEFFTREGDDIICDLQVNFAQAALGTEVEIPTLESAVKLKVPAGSQPGSIFRLKGKGARHLGYRGRGDQVVRLKVITPDKLSEAQRRLFEELARTWQQPQK